MIKGLTDRCPRYPRIGILRKGAPKPGDRPGRDLSYFRLVTKEKSVEKKFHEIYGAQPTDINICFPYPTVEANFQAWREEWKGGGLIHRCDGENTVLRFDQKRGFFLTGPEYQIPCPGGCIPYGRLQFIIPELKRFAIIELITGSKWDIIAIQENLSGAFIPRQDLRGIPFILKRRPRKIYYQDLKGKRKSSMRSLISLEIHPDWMERHLSHMERLALPEEGAPLSVDPPDQHDIEAPENGEDDEDQKQGEAAIPEELRGAVELGVEEFLIRKWLKECSGNMGAVKVKINRYLEG